MHAPNTKLPPRDTGVPAWSEVKEKDRDWWDLRMAAYAAMIDRMDRNIGRLLEKLKETGELENTVIFFLSDNGAEADSKDRSSVKGSMPWEVTSYLTQGKPWANASNTPFRKYKTTPYEGGIHTPMIAYWPGKLAKGKWTDDLGHLIDYTPTFLELAGVKVPESLPGQSLVPTLLGKPTEQSRPLYWSYGGSVLRDGDWKLVGRKKTWELYNLTKDPTEQVNLADKHPDRVKKMTKQWKAWRENEGKVE